MRLTLLGYAGRIAIDNMFAVFASAALIMAGVLLALPGTGKSKIHRATITEFGPAVGTTKPRLRVSVILPDGRHEILSLANAARCKIDSILLVTETPKQFVSALEADPMGCR
jgi:hypothetical protein